MISPPLIVLLACADGAASIVFTSCHVCRLDLAPLVWEQQQLLKVGVVFPEHYLWLSISFLVVVKIINCIVYLHVMKNHSWNYFVDKIMYLVLKIAGFKLWSLFNRTKWLSLFLSSKFHNSILTTWIILYELYILIFKKNDVDFLCI